MGVLVNAFQAVTLCGVDCFLSVVSSKHALTSLEFLSTMSSICTVLCLVLAVTCLNFCGGDRSTHSAPPEGKIATSLRLHLERAQAQISKRNVEAENILPISVWVYFKNKRPASEPSTADIVKQTLRKEAEARLSSKAIHRRKHRGRFSESSIVDESDIDVNSTYVQQVLAYNATLRSTSRWLNAISVSAHTTSQVHAIAELDCVRKVDVVRSFFRDLPKGGEQRDESLHFDRRDSSSPYGRSEPALQLINVIEAHRRGFNGSGVSILSIDAGFHLPHPAFDRIHLVAQHDFVYDDDDVTDDPDHDPHQTYGQDYHGTATLGILGGYVPNELIGVAFAASYLLAKTEDITSETPIEEDRWVEALEWGERLGAEIVTSSLGYSAWYDESSFDGETAVTTIAISHAVKRGILVVTSNGNLGQRGITAPADTAHGLSTGAINLRGKVASFSSRGPTSDGRIKPDVSAPGVNVFSASVLLAGGEYKMDYGLFSGTSFACPHVAGVAALILQAHPDWTPMQVKQAILETASNAAHPDNTRGWGIIDATEAINFQPFERDTCPNSCSKHGACTLGEAIPCACYSGYYGIDCSQVKSIQNQ